MRRAIVSLLLSGLALSACTVTETDNQAANAGGQAGSGGQGGSAGASGQGGDGGQCQQPLPGPECGEVDEGGFCACGNQVQRCQNVAPDDGGESTSRLVTEACASNEQCAVDAKGEAHCRPLLACQAGDSYCQGNQLFTCKSDGSGFEGAACQNTQACKAEPGQKPACVSALGGAAGDDPILKGRIRYETRELTSDKGVSDVFVGDAFLQFVAVYNGDKYIGSAITKFDGTFEAKLTEKPTDKTIVYAYALDFKPNSQEPLVGVVRWSEESEPKRRGEDYWFWSNQGDSGCGLKAAPVKLDGEAPGISTMDELTIPITCGSGAVRVFQWIRWGMLLTGSPDYGVPATKDLPQTSVMVYWEPGKTPSRCKGACFSTSDGTVPLPEGKTDRFDNAIYIPGTSDSPKHWSPSVLGHETGHWAMYNYSITPREGGSHSFGTKSKPGLAWSEGFATFFGQWGMSDPASDRFDTKYISISKGTVWWEEIETLRDSIPRPDPAGVLDQQLSEAITVSMLWHLWGPQKAGMGPYQNLGVQGIFASLVSKRVTSADLNRGYKRVDMLDFLDGLRCHNLATNAQITPVTDHYKYPWDNQPNCPQ